MQDKMSGMRLVGWKQYLLTQGATWIGNSFGVGLAIGGFVFLMGAIVILAAGVETRFLGFLFSVLFCGIGSLCVWASTTVLRETDKIEPVALLTRHNTGQLPAAETLVRGSHRPETAGAGELLRAASQGAETPSDQLLRAIQGKGQDV